MLAEKFQKSSKQPKLFKRRKKVTNDEPAQYSPLLRLPHSTYELCIGGLHQPHCWAAGGMTQGRPDKVMKSRQNSCQRNKMHGSCHKSNSLRQTYPWPWSASKSPAQFHDSARADSVRRSQTKMVPSSEQLGYIYTASKIKEKAPNKKSRITIHNPHFTPFLFNLLYLIIKPSWTLTSVTDDRWPHKIDLHAPLLSSHTLKTRISADEEYKLDQISAGYDSISPKSALSVAQAIVLRTEP